MQIYIKKTADEYSTTDSILKELEERIGQHEAENPAEKVLSLLNEAADLLESTDQYTNVYDVILQAIDMFSNKDVVEITPSEEVEEEIQKELEEQK